MNGLTRCDEPTGIIIGPITLTGQLYYQGLPPGPGPRTEARHDRRPSAGDGDLAG